MLFVNKIDEKLKTVCNDCGIKLRPDASSGILLVFLLPITILWRNIQCNHDHSTFTTDTISYILLLTACTQLLKITLCENSSLKVDSFVVAQSLLIGLILWWNVGFITSFLIGLFLVSTYTWGLHQLLYLCPNSFTFGEATVLIQASIIFLVSSIKNIIYSYKNKPVLDVDIATVILQIGLLGVVLIIYGLLICPSLRKSVCFYGWCAFILMLEVFLPLHVIIQCSPVLWIIQLLFSDLKTVFLVIYWVMCCLLAVAAIAVQVYLNNQASTITRKSFHLLAVAVYMPGMLHAYCLLYTASGVVLAIFIMLEVMRKLHIPPLDAALQQGFEVFVDEKDAGSIALTPLYLLVGVSLPIWLHPVPQDHNFIPLPLLAGLLGIGLGDTAASAAGTWFGRNRWPDSKKTYEGTLACICIQLVAIIGLGTSGYLGDFSYTKCLYAIVITSLVEAKTDQTLLLTILYRMTMLYFSSLSVNTFTDDDARWHSQSFILCLAVNMLMATELSVLIGITPLLNCKDRKLV